MNLKHTPLAQEWHDRLISGNYPQGKYHLKNEIGEYCCLGVLGDVLVENGILITEVISDGKTAYRQPGDTLSGTEYLPTSLFEDLVYLDQEKYGELNDGKLYTFEQIAQIVKEDYID